MCASAAVGARVWTDSSGRYSLEADLIAFDDETVVLQRADHHLGAVPIEKLSDADREYLKSKEAIDATQEVTGKMQTWTMQSGLKVLGRVVDYARRDMTVQRRRGRVYVNDRQFENLPEIYQRMVPRIVAHFEELRQPDKNGLEAWLIRQRGEPRTFSLEGVILELENGDEYGVPFFFFSEADLKVLRPGWEEWLKAHKEDNYENQEDQTFMLQAAAAARFRDQQVDRQIAMMQLNLQAVQAGVTSLWEVTLFPAAAGVGPPLWVVMPGRNSAQATAAAMQANPGYVAGPIRRVSF
jgi:hypothetical protein